jgi:hypothetical protein
MPKVSSHKPVEPPPGDQNPGQQVDLDNLPTASNPPGRKPAGPFKSELYYNPESDIGCEGVEVLMLISFARRYDTQFKWNPKWKRRFGPNLSAFIRRIQARANIAPSGTVDADTREVLNKIYAQNSKHFDIMPDLRK